MASKKVSRYEVYQLLIGTHEYGGGCCFSATKIANFLGVSRQYISKLTKDMLVSRYITCNNPKGSEKFYSATCKPYNRSLSTKSEPSSEIALQKARYEITMEREYTNFFENKQHWMHGNCAHYKHSTKIFDSMGIWQFEKVGKNKLIIIMPEMIFKKENLAQAKNTMFTILYEALKWFAHEAKIKFKWDTLHMCQKPNVCRPARDSKAIRVARDFSLNIDGKMLDMSSGKADWETTILDEDMVDTVDALENWDNIASMKGDVRKLTERMNVFENVQLPSIQKCFDNIFKEILNINRLLNPELKPDDQDNPSYV